MNGDYVHITVLLDRTGSMESIRGPDVRFTEEDRARQKKKRKPGNDDLPPNGSGEVN